MPSYEAFIQKPKTWVVKIGSSILTNDSGVPSPKIFNQIASDVSKLIRQKIRVVLVSSGAIACGMHQLGFKKKPQGIGQKQAIAAAGQIDLMNHYAKAFSKQRLKIAQILLTREDLTDRKRYLNAHHAIHELLELGVVPIINENDTVAVEEIKFGDNDNLSALVTHLVGAKLLVILTDQEGVYTSDPRSDAKAKKIEVIEKIEDRHHRLAKDTRRAASTGGMVTKIEAASKAAALGVATLITSGRTKGILEKLASGNKIGTLILPKRSALKRSTAKRPILK